ncbi:hypothetical protein VE02_09484 [Pseudogymnoascus sp. 03VT05]|nr:hypothetical protein VE02_09484 [Pseudogymnoascus sp. 03VT05]
MKLSFGLPLALLAGAIASPLASVGNSTFYNPVLPGWHSDPSCIQVKGTFFCAISTFISFPGIPIYASKDLINWKLVSHAWNRESQLPGVSASTVGQQDGMFAATIRYHDGEFHVACEYLGLPDGITDVVFKTRDPFNDKAWSDPVTFKTSNIDPDLFWDDNGKVYSVMAANHRSVYGTEREAPTLKVPIYTRKTGGIIYISEGGTEGNHSVTIARSHTITGPYESNRNNPILTNRGTDEYFQTFGHADLFQDTNGKWWGMSLATRTGPELEF